jgi:hypothetical protein
VNIAATMATLEVEDLDRTAKQVVHVIACRADLAGAARVSIERVARDCGIAYGTAWRALQRAVKAGYVVVENPGDNRCTWRLTSRVCARSPSRVDDGPFARSRPKGRAPTRDRRMLRIKDKESAPARARREAAPAVAVDNGHAAPTRHADTCLCGGSGWVAGDDATVTRCPYRPEVVR